MYSETALSAIYYTAVQYGTEVREQAARDKGRIEWPPFATTTTRLNETKATISSTIAVSMQARYRLD